MKLGKRPSKHTALLTVAVVLMLGGAIVLVAGWVPAGIAVAAIAVGIALVVIEQGDARRRRAGPVRHA